MRENLSHFKNLWHKAFLLLHIKADIFLYSLLLPDIETR